MSETMIDHSFGWALANLHAGFNLTRRGWGDDVWITLDEDAQCIFIYRGNFVTEPVEIEKTIWGIFQDDVLTNDWEIVKRKNL